MDSWALEEFQMNNIPYQIIEFLVEKQVYVMIFTRVDVDEFSEIIKEIETDLGIKYRENSYQVKFDLRENLESDDFYKKPAVKISVGGMRDLGCKIKDILEFHYHKKYPEAYICIAENEKLKRFYDRLTKNYGTSLKFSVISDLGEEGLSYEIRTESYKS